MKNRTSRRDERFMKEVRFSATDPDFTCCYSSQGLPLIRPENERAQNEFDDNVAEYSYHLQRWYNADGTSEWFKPSFSEPAIFLNPKHDCNELVIKLRNKGFRLVLEKRNTR